MKTQCGIYEIRNTINDKCYYGSTNNWMKRKSKHRKELEQNKHHSPYLQRSWNKYGKDAFQFNFLLEVFPEYLLFVEQIYLNNNFRDGKAIGYNTNPIADKPPAQYGRKMSEENKRKISEANKGRKHSPEHREKNRLAKLGNKASEATKEKMRKARLGYVFSEDTKRKIGEANTGKKRSIEAKDKMRLSALGKTRSEETRKKMSEAHKLRWKERKAIINNTTS